MLPARYLSLLERVGKGEFEALKRVVEAKVFSLHTVSSGPGTWNYLQAQRTQHCDM